MSSTRPVTSRVPCATCTRAPLTSGLPLPGTPRNARWASKRSVALAAPGAARKSPGRTSSVDTAFRLRATRCPASARSTGSPCTCTLRTRVRRPEGSTSTSSPVRADPLHRVPVTTVPAPLMLNTRSTGRRRREPAFARRVVRAARVRASCSSGSPAPVRLDTGTISASAKGVPARRPRTSSAMNSAHSSSTRSVFVSATTQVRMPRSSSTARCSSVCGMMPSSAAMQRSARSMPVDPAIIWRTKRSWPGTSTTPSTVPSGSARRAKPSSMVMPRCFSSARRSGSVPVKASTSDDLPWSIWPAVPSTRSVCVRLLMRGSPRLRRRARRSRRARPRRPRLARPRPRCARPAARRRA